MKNNNSSRFFSFFSSKYISSLCIIAFSFLGLTLSSCEQEPEPIGIGDEQLINTYYTDTVTVNVKVFQSDSINTTSRIGNSRLLMGSLADEYVGRYSAQGFGNISLTTLTEDLQNDAGQGAIFDSLVGFFQTDYVYGDTLAENTIQIYEVSETFENKAYYQFDTLRTSSSILGSAIYPNDLDSNQVLRVPLSEEFGIKLFNYGVNNNFENDSLFRIFSKGLAFRSASPTTSILGINPLAPATNLTLYFHYPDDTVSSSYRFDMPVSFSNIDSDVSNSALSALTTQDFIPSENTNNIAAIQAGTGIGVKLEFPYLSDFVTNQSVVIQRVELDIPALEPAMSYTTPAPNQLLFLFGAGDGFYYSPTGTIQFLQAESGGDAGLSMGYSTQGKSYSYATITSYINQFAKGRIPESDGLIVQPSENNISINRFVFPTQKNTNNLPAIRLRMYYSVAE
ncbi:MAG: hypothetical protein COZ18_01170 [Flexibacter sp. CG_4_10_14_3_um_filter_32_15]|nr:MAG: hypothetical protein COZ18_01170 [Flexibacter sp. CG_4_10_14_3_um_filter_32_15]